MARLSVHVIALAACLATPTAASAQATATNVASANAGDALLYLLQANKNHAAPVDDVGVAQAIVSFVNSQISTFPVATSWAGATLRLMPDGSVERVPASLGPLFAERPFVLGRHHWSFGATVQPVRWRSIDGIDLANDGIMFQQQTPNDTQTWRSVITIRSVTVVAGASVGLTNRLDVGISVPVSRVEVSGSSTRIKVGLDGTIKPQAGPNSTDGISQGMGDLSLRAKYNFLNSGDKGWALSGEWRLPTGNQAALLGTGSHQLRTTVIGATTIRAVSPHVNIGYVWTGKGISVSPPPQPAGKVNPVLIGPFPNTYVLPDQYIQLGGIFDVQPSNELTYNGGFDVKVTERLTLDADFIGRVVRNSATLQNLPFQYPVAGPANPPPYLAASQPFLVLGTQHLLFGVAGAKLAVGRTVLTAHVLIPGSQSGLVPAPTLLFGIERAMFREPSACGC